MKNTLIRLCVLGAVLLSVACQTGSSSSGTSFGRDVGGTSYSGYVGAGGPKPAASWYTQSALSVPTALNESYLTNDSPTLQSGTKYLWSLLKLNINFSVYTLPVSEIIVAVIDTGVDRDHPDLAGRLWLNPNEATGGRYQNGSDDDGNGLVDDFMGYDFINDINNPIDDNGHGTHVAGTIAAIGGNGQGIVGVAPWVRIMSLKVCNAQGLCDSSDIRAAILYAARNGAKVINMSLGALDTGYEAQAFDATIRTATNLGATVVVSSGNYGSNVEYTTPANAKDAIAVGAHRQDDLLCGFSNYGYKLDIAAPGCGGAGFLDISAILSLNSQKCGYSYNQACTSRNTVTSQYSLKQGTSMAAPHVAGLAALALTANPSATPYQVRQAILQSTRSSNNKDLFKGRGLASGQQIHVEAARAIGLKILSPTYGASGTNQTMTVRFETKNETTSFRVKQISTSGLGTAHDLTNTGAVTVGWANVPTNTNVEYAINIAPTSNEDLVIVEADVNGRRYFDTVVLRR